MTMYPVKIAFSKSCRRIAVEVKDADKADKAEKGVFEKTEMETRTLTEKEKEKLTTGTFWKRSFYLKNFTEKFF